MIVCKALLVPAGNDNATGVKQYMSMEVQTLLHLSSSNTVSSLRHGHGHAHAWQCYRAKSYRPHILEQSMVHVLNSDIATPCIGCVMDPSAERSLGPICY